MPATSPLDHSELRLIERTLDEGNTQEAATRLGLLGDASDHKDAIDFLTTRLLFQRGRIDSDGAADRIGAILERVGHFPEAEDWLTELEGRTERSAFADDPGAAARAPTPPPPSQAPAIPRHPGPEHPYFDEIGPDEDDVTPTESDDATRADAPRLILEGSVSSRPSAIPADALAAEPPTRPDVERIQAGAFEPPTRPDLMLPTASLRPSYKPFDSLRAKEQLSIEAGRYRGGVNDPGEVVAGRRRSRAPRATQTSRSPSDAERRIIEAFQLVRSGMLDEARRMLPEEGAPSTTRPELRAMLARVLLELGDAERANAEATYALEHAPHSPEAQLVYVWSAVRYARQRDDAWSLEHAGRILKDFPGSAAADASLLVALTACVEVREGVPSVALRLAQRALRGDADCVDGLAALVEASALTGEPQRAEAALERLYALDEDAAEQLAPRLQRLGVGKHGPTSSASVWLPLEHTLASGAREVALAGLEALAAEALGKSPLQPWKDAEAAAAAAVEFFALSPVLRHFGPYDLSLHGIARLEAALALIYGSGPRALDVSGSTQFLWQLAGVYLGESLRACCEGRWLAEPEQLRDASIELLGTEVQPFQVVRHRLLHGRHAPFQTALGEVLALAGPAAHGFRKLEAVAPALPWREEEWPGLEEMPRLGRAFAHSVVATYLTSLGEPRLDRGASSLSGLDRYVELVASAHSPLPTDARRTRWLCVFLGAYLGEVLCKELGGAWAEAARPGAEAYVVTLGERRETPVALAFDGLTGRHPISFVDYLDQLRQTLGSP